MAGVDSWPLLTSWSPSTSSAAEVLFKSQPTRVADLPISKMRSERHPLLCYGANASTEGLSRKFSNLEGEHTVAPVIAGWLKGFDVGPSAHFSSYGAMPGTLFTSAEVSYRVAVAWVTEPQLEAISRREFNYLFGLMPGPDFTADIGDLSSDTSPLAFASRHGVLLSAEDDPIAFAAISARGRDKPP